MDRVAAPAYASGMTKPYTEPDADDTKSPPRHHGSHDVATRKPPRQHETHDAPMKPGRRPGC